MLIVDGRIGFTGGVGMADEWTGHAQDPDHWRDLHFRVEGPVVAQFQAAFLDNWIKTTGRVLNGPAYFPELAPAGELKMHMFISSPAGGSESMRLYLMAITAAEESIDIEAAYFIPDALMSSELIKARARGVEYAFCCQTNILTLKLFASRPNEPGARFWKAASKSMNTIRPCSIARC